MENLSEIPIIEPDKNGKGYWEVYKDKKIWHENKKPMIKIPSKKQLDEERPKFSLLPHDDYELVIVDLKRGERSKYLAKPDKDGNVPKEKIIDFTFEIASFKDGTPAKDVEGNDATGRKVFFTGRPESMGFMSDGTPSKTRSLVAYALGQDVEGEIEFEEWEQLLGKTVYAEIVQYTTQRGEKKNKIARFIPPPRKHTK